MDKMQASQTVSLLAKLGWMLRHRPMHLLRTARCYLLFCFSRFMRRLVSLNGITLGANVRLQRNSSLMAEHPSASITIGKDSIIYEDCCIEAYGSAKVHVAEGAILGGVRIVSRHAVKIGARCLGSWNVFLQDFDPHPVSQTARRVQVENMLTSFRPWFEGPLQQPTKLLGWDFPGDAIEIGDDVWLGAGATILKGAHIGEGCIVASGAVVLKGNYPARSLIAGNPAVVVKSLEDAGKFSVVQAASESIRLKKEA